MAHPSRDQRDVPPRFPLPIAIECDAVIAMHVPRLVTIEIGGSGGRDIPDARKPLCPDELVTIVNELADLRVRTVRFAVLDTMDRGILSRPAAHARHRGLATIVALLTPPAKDAVRDIALLRPTTIAVPLNGHIAAIHGAIPGGLAWGDAVAITTTIAHSGVPPAIETRASCYNAASLRPLAELIENLGVTLWSIDFRDVQLPPQTLSMAADVILDIAARDVLTIAVHDLPIIRPALLGRLHTAARRVPDFRRLDLLERGETIVISADGDVTRDGLVVGNVRTQAVNRVAA
jgi:hypothetical protein